MIRDLDLTAIAARPAEPVEKIEKTFLTLDGNFIIAEPNLVSNFSITPLEPAASAYLTPLLGDSSSIEMGEFLGNWAIKKNNGVIVRWLDIEVIDLYITDLLEKIDINLVRKNKPCEPGDLTYVWEPDEHVTKENSDEFL